MKVRFVNLRRPGSEEELSNTQKKQLQEAGRRYDGRNLSAEKRLSSESFGPTLSLWDVEVDGKHRIDAFLFMGDAGLLFQRGTTNVVAQRVQSEFESGDPDFDEALQHAVYERNEEANLPAQVVITERPKVSAPQEEIPKEPKAPQAAPEAPAPAAPPPPATPVETPPAPKPMPAPAPPPPPKPTAVAPVKPIAPAKKPAPGSAKAAKTAKAKKSKAAPAKKAKPTQKAAKKPVKKAAKVAKKAAKKQKK